MSAYLDQTVSGRDVLLPEFIDAVKSEFTDASIEAGHQRIHQHLISRQRSPYQTGLFISMHKSALKAVPLNWRHFMKAVATVTAMSAITSNARLVSPQRCCAAYIDLSHFWKP